MTPQLLLQLGLQKTRLFLLRRRRARLHAQVAQVYIDIDRVNDDIRHINRRIDASEYAGLTHRNA